MERTRSAASEAATPPQNQDHASRFTTSGKCSAARLLGMPADVMNRLTARQWRVLTACLHHATRIGGTFWPSLDRLATMTGISRQEVCRARTALRKLGFIEPTGERRGRVGGGVPVWRFVAWTETIPAPSRLLSPVAENDNGLLSRMTTLPQSPSLRTSELSKEQDHHHQEPNAAREADDDDVHFVQSIAAAAPLTAAEQAMGDRICEDDAISDTLIEKHGFDDDRADHCTYWAFKFCHDGIGRGWDIKDPVAYTIKLILNNPAKFNKPLPWETYRATLAGRTEHHAAPVIAEQPPPRIGAPRTPRPAPPPKPPDVPPDRPTPSMLKAGLDTIRAAVTHVELEANRQ
jgi:hypothetical protein